MLEEHRAPHGKASGYAAGHDLVTSVTGSRVFSLTLFNLRSPDLRKQLSGDKPPAKILASNTMHIGVLKGMRILSALLLIFVAHASNAAPVVWEINTTATGAAGVSQDPVLIGTIVYDADAAFGPSVISSNLTYDASYYGPLGGAPQLLNFDVAGGYPPDLNFHDSASGQWFANPNWDPTIVTGAFSLSMSLDQELTNAGGNVGFSAEVTFCRPDPELGCDGPVEVFTENSFSGTLTATAVPVPAAVWLFGSALAGLGWFRRKQTA